MGQERGLWFPTQRLNSLSSLALSHLGMQDSNLLSKHCGTTDKFSTLGSHGWIHQPFHSQQQFLPPQNPYTNQMSLQVECQYSQKRFLVFDQSGDQTTMLLTSNTLVSANGDQETFSESCGKYVKKRKIQEISTPFLKISNENMRDAESSCGSCDNTEIGCSKRSKTFSNKIGEKKIFETISLLRSIIPGEELMDPILVIDRAIDYLKSLRIEAENRWKPTM